MDLHHHSFCVPQCVVHSLSKMLKGDQCDLIFGTAFATLEPDLPVHAQSAAGCTSAAIALRTWRQ